MLVGKNVILRLFTEHDIDEYLELNKDPRALGAYIPICLMSDVSQKQRFQQTGFWQDTWGQMLITTKDNIMVGMINFFPTPEFIDGYEIGYQIFRKEHRNKHYMSEALPLFAAYLFSVKPIHRLQVSTIVENIPSQRIAIKAGFSQEGILSQALFHHGTYKDLVLFSLLREECRPLQELLAPDTSI